MENSETIPAQDINTLNSATPSNVVAAPAVKAKNPALDSLKPGETLLVKARGVKGDKVELEFAERVDNPNKKAGTSNPLVSLLNKSDARFDASGPRRGWITGTKADIQEMLGLDVSTLALGQEIMINKVNPTLGGQRLRLQIAETTKATEYQAANIEKSAKRRGKDGAYITHGGMYIFANTYIIPSTDEVIHVWLESDEVAETTGIVAGATPVSAVEQAAQAAAGALAV
tara:strand:- start:122 stop:808 length:687 start_codon:yes stop_codon:yes gene_type:complete